MEKFFLITNKCKPIKYTQLTAANDLISIPTRIVIPATDVENLEFVELTPKIRKASVHHFCKTGCLRDGEKGQV